MRAVPSGCLPLTPLELAAPKRDAGAIAGDAEDGDGLAGGRGQGGLRFAQNGSGLPDEASKVAARELESEASVKALRRLLKRAAMGRGAADDPREAGRVAAHQIKGVVQRTTPSVSLGVAVVSAAQPDDAKERVHLTRAGRLDDFQRPRRLIIGEQRAVIEQPFDKTPRIAKQGVAQARFEALDDARHAFLGDRLAKRREEGFRFAVSFLKTFRAEFFFASLSADAGAADKAAL